MSIKSILEPESQVPIYDECDVLVVGGGSAGHSAAIAAARAGCKNVILMERYGYCGGDVTGGYVLLVPALSFYDKTYVQGIQEEWFTRLEKIPRAVAGPPMELAGSKDPEIIKKFAGVGGATMGPDPRVMHGFTVDPTEMKIEMDKMLDEEKDRIRVLYHSWGCKPIMEGNVCKGVFFESKEGRKAVMAKVVIDATGDADICRLSGAPTSNSIDDECRCGSSALVYRVGGFSRAAFNEWFHTDRDGAKEFMQGLAKIHGFMAAMIDGPTDEVSWVNNWQPHRDCSKIVDLTATEMGTRLKLREVIDFMRKASPVLKDAYLYDIAPQTGVRGSHRIVGEHIISSDDWAFPKEHEDVIAWHCTVESLNDNAPIEIPYRSILPQKVDNLLAPGRHISADKIAIDCVNLVPQCVGTGQAAGVAAAVAVADGTTAHSVDIKKVQDILAGEQNVPLPRNEHTDKSYTENLIEHEYGLYTPAAQKAIAAKDAAGTYRHWTLSKGAALMNEASEHMSDITEKDK
ncbi:MAG: FAD-dependent oxidoreductase [Lachnospiraceae bacterium]|nr:FAD-dependent oxidoreductase [Lachnospiraceae bacterium]